jgi:hypothetical protein
MEEIGITHVPKVTTVVFQVHLNLALHVVACASYCHAVTV